MTTTAKFAIAAVGLWLFARWRAQQLLTPAAARGARPNDARGLSHESDADRVFAPIGAFYNQQPASVDFRSSLGQSSTSTSTSTTPTGSPAPQPQYPIDFPAPDGGWIIVAGDPEPPPPPPPSPPDEPPYTPEYPIVPDIQDVQP